MSLELKTQIVTDAMDLMAGFEKLANTEKPEQLQCVIDTLGSYPKPQKKTDIARCSNENLGAYLCVSNVRNTCKLSEIGLHSYTIVLNTIHFNLELALSLLSQ